MPDRKVLSLLHLLIVLLIRYSFASEVEQNHSRSPLWNATSTDKLKRDLLMGYDKFARPTNHTKITPVDFNFHVAHVNIDEAKFLMTMNVYITLTWYDDKLKWNPTDYDGIAKLHVADHEIWDPDVYIMNSAAGNNIGNAICFVYNDGLVHWHPPAQFSTFCELDLTKWPFDRHICSLGVGSFAYYNEVNFTAKNLPDIETHWSVRSEWRISEITRASTEYTITYTITVERYGSSYISTVILPAAALVLITLAVFWLPFQAQERFLLSSISIVLLSINLVFISYKLPFMGANTPVIVIFTSAHLLMAGISIILSVITFNLSTTKRPMPWYIQMIMKGPMSSYLGLSMCKVGQGEDAGGHGEEMRGYGYDGDGREDHRILDQGPPQAARMWNALASLVNRVAFLIYVITFLGLTLSAIS
uniref:Neurotransmitter-gated ion-channel ligand-binding domain-containing protein n=2 Tax=Lygus hesperus TaxID=30085 RepID=A0A0K8TB30_LYGHE